MKRLLFIIIAALSVFMLPVTALADSTKTEVTGVVSYQGQHVGKNVEVTVSCNGHTKTDKTNKEGAYSVRFTAQQCPKNSMVTATSTVNGQTGTATGKVTSSGKCKVNVAVVPINVVPEFGALSAAGAGVTGVGAFLFIRRRQSDGNVT